MITLLPRLKERGMRMRRFHVITTQKNKEGEDIKTEYYIDVAEQDVEELESTDKKTKMIELAHKVFFDHIKFFTYIAISSLALIGFILKTGRATPASSMVLIGSILAFVALMFFFVWRAVDRYLKKLPEEWNYDALSIHALKSVIYALSALFFVVGIALIIIAFKFLEKGGV